MRATGKHIKQATLGCHVQEDKPARQARAHAIATPQTRTPHAATRQLPPEGQALVQSAGVSLVTQQQRAHAPLAAAACPGAAMLQQVIQLRLLADCLDVLGQQAQRPVLEVASGAVTTVLVQLPAAAGQGAGAGSRRAHGQDNKLAAASLCIC